MNADCPHPLKKVTVGICQGDWPNQSVQWCQLCGAFRVPHYDPTYSLFVWTAWRIPNAEEKTKYQSQLWRESLTEEI